MIRAPLIALCLAMAIFGGADAATAHYGPALSGTGTAVIDGVLASGEWDGAETTSTETLVSYPGWPGNGDMRVMSDDTNIYVAVRIPFEPLTGFNVGGAITLDLDNDDDGVLNENGDDLWVVNPIFDAVDAVRIACPDGIPGCSTFDTVVGGTNDLTASIGHDGNFVVVEMRHPIVSGDPNDIALIEGRRVGYQLGYTLFKSDGSAQGRLLGDIELKREGSVVGKGHFRSPVGGTEFGVHVDATTSVFGFQGGPYHLFGAFTVEGFTQEGNEARFHGTGAFEGADVTYEVTLVDKGFPGRNDTIDVVVRHLSGVVAYTSGGPQLLKTGNITITSG